MSASIEPSAPPEFHLDFGDPAFVRDPWPILAAMQATAPVVLNTGRPDIYLATGFAACQRVLGRVNDFHSLPEYLTDLFGGVVFEAIDSPEHDLIRGVWADQFRREDLDRDQGQVVADVVERAISHYLERVRSGERVDAVSELTFEIPGLVMAEMLGLGGDEARELIRSARGMAKLHAGLVTEGSEGERLVSQARESTARLNQLMDEEIERRRIQPGDDLISRMVTSDVAATMSKRDLVATCSQLVFAGSETSAKLMAHALVVLAGHPDQRRLVRDDRTLLDPAIEELIRYIGPVQAGPAREVAASGATLDGLALQPGTKIMPLMAAANRDPGRWESPDEFCVTRPRQRHLGFGFGMHSCLGQNLARLEVVSFLSTLLDRAPEWALDGPVDYGVDFTVRGPQQIFLTSI